MTKRIIIPIMGTRKNVLDSIFIFGEWNIVSSGLSSVLAVEMNAWWTFILVKQRKILSSQTSFGIPPLIVGLLGSEVNYRRLDYPIITYGGYIRRIYCRGSTTFVRVTTKE
jgi:hypothetical protein